MSVPAHHPTGRALPVLRLLGSNPAAALLRGGVWSSLSLVDTSKVARLEMGGCPDGEALSS